jgi:O-antigen ligase
MYIVCDTLFALYIVVRFRPDDQMRLLAFIGAIATFLSFLVVAIYPRAGVDAKTALGAWQGVYPHKNFCAVMTLFLLVPAVLLPLKGVMRLCRNLYVLAALFLVVMTKARTGWIFGILLFCFICILKLSRRVGRKERILITLALSLAVVACAYVCITWSSSILLVLGKDPTMTGRTAIWEAVAHSALKQPLLGYGYFGFWNGFQGEAANTALAASDLSLGNAENGVLQLWLELGSVGVILLVLMLFRTVRNSLIALRANPSSYVEWYACVAFYSVLSLVDGGKFMYPHAIDWVLYLIADAGLAAEVSRLRRGMNTTPHLGLQPSAIVSPIGA